MYNNAKLNNGRKWQGKEDKKIVCYYCRKRHVITECSENEAKSKTFKKLYKKKTLRASWDSKSESEEEVDTAHVCFMAKDNTTKITSESHLDECKLSMDELGDIRVKGYEQNTKMCQTRKL